MILIVGVNGNGKTTSVAKLAKFYQNQGKKVLLAAADTFRAAAVEQLERWAHKLDIDIVKGASKSDPASVAFDAVTAAKARHSDILIIDTAGRLHTKTHLMQELEKIKRSCHKILPGSPHEILLVLDARPGKTPLIKRPFSINILLLVDWSSLNLMGLLKEVLLSLSNNI